MEISKVLKRKGRDGWTRKCEKRVEFLKMEYNLLQYTQPSVKLCLL
jgi:hypothetical protein